MTTSEILLFIPPIMSAFAAVGAWIVAITSEILLIIPPIMSAFAAVGAWIVAIMTLRHQKFLEHNRVQFLKHQIEVDHLQKLIASFAEINFWLFSEWEDERNKNIDRSIHEMKFSLSVLKSLNTSISSDIKRWELDEKAEFSRIIYYEIGQLHPVSTEKYRVFLTSKMDELIMIQDRLFSSISER